MNTEAGSPREYGRIHYRARKALAGSTCEHCGTADRIEAALWPGTDPSRLRVDPATGCRYSIEVSDYHPLCHPCHFKMDAEGRETCANGHERTAENTSYRPDGTRRCAICHREEERTRKSDPQVRARINARQRELKRPLTGEQRARKTALQRARRAADKAARMAGTAA